MSRDGLCMLSDLLLFCKRLTTRRYRWLRIHLHRNLRTHLLIGELLQWLLTSLQLSSIHGFIQHTWIYLAYMDLSSIHRFVQHTSIYLAYIDLASIHRFIQHTSIYRAYIDLYNIHPFIQHRSIYLAYIDCLAYIDLSSIHRFIQHTSIYLAYIDLFMYVLGDSFLQVYMYMNELQNGPLYASSLFYSSVSTFIQRAFIVCSIISGQQLSTHIIYTLFQFVTRAVLSCVYCIRYKVIISVIRYVVSYVTLLYMYHQKEIKQ